MYWENSDLSLWKTDFYNICKQCEVIWSDCEINRSIYQTIKFMTIETLKIYLDYRVNNLYKENDWLNIDLLSLKLFYSSRRKREKKNIYWYIRYSDTEMKYNNKKVYCYRKCLTMNFPWFILRIFNDAISRIKYDVNLYVSFYKKVR